MPESAPQFGSPKFWPKFIKKFQPVIGALCVAGQALNSNVDGGYDRLEPWRLAVLNLGRLSSVGMMELITLAANGCGHGAMKILRSMLETTIDAEFLRLRPERFSECLDWSHFERWKLYESLKRVAPAAYEQLGNTETARAKGEFDRVRPILQQGGRDRTRWCGMNLREEAKQAGLEALYEPINPLASRLLHGGMFGLLLHWKPADVHRIDVPPSMDWCQQALVGGHSCLRQTIKTLSEALGVEPPPTLAEVKGAEVKAWQAVTATAETAYCGQRKPKLIPGGAR